MYSIYEELRNQAGLSDYAFSKQSGVPRSVLSDWKTGKHTPNLENLKKIAYYFGVSVDLFIRSEEAQSVVNRVTAEFNAPETVDERDQYYFDLYRKDREFWENIRLLFYLPAPEKETVYNVIRGQVSKATEEEKKEGQVLESSKVG